MIYSMLKFSNKDVSLSEILTQPRLLNISPNTLPSLFFALMLAEDARSDKTVGAPFSSTRFTLCSLTFSI